jgi:hypothetical protein
VRTSSTAGGLDRWSGLFQQLRQPSNDARSLRCDLNSQACTFTRPHKDCGGWISLSTGRHVGFWGEYYPPNITCGGVASRARTANPTWTTAETQNRTGTLTFPATLKTTQIPKPKPKRVVSLRSALWNHDVEGTKEFEFTAASSPQCQFQFLVYFDPYSTSISLYEFMFILRNSI